MYCDRNHIFYLLPVLPASDRRHLRKRQRPVLSFCRKISPHLHADDLCQRDPAYVRRLFTSIGKARLGVIMSLTRQVLFLLPLIVIFPVFFGIDGVMYAGPIADTSAFVLAVVFARRELGVMKAAEQNA